MNADLLELPPLTRLLFAGLWCHADRKGRIQDRPKQIKLAILPADECNPDEMLAALQEKGFIERYEASGTKVIQIIKFLKHQNPHTRETPSDLPGNKHDLGSAQHGASPEKKVSLRDLDLDLDQVNGSDLDREAAAPDPDPASPSPLVSGCKLFRATEAEMAFIRSEYKREGWPLDWLPHAIAEVDKWLQGEGSEAQKFLRLPSHAGKLTATWVLERAKTRATLTPTKSGKLPQHKVFEGTKPKTAAEKEAERKRAAEVVEQTKIQIRGVA